MKEERAQILEMLQKGKITVDEADMLLEALNGRSNSIIPIRQKHHATRPVQAN